MGSTEACEILGIQKMTLSRWMRPGSGKPESCHGEDKTYMITPAKVSNRPVWVRSDVELFREMIGRQRAPMGSGDGSADDKP